MAKRKRRTIVANIDGHIVLLNKYVIVGKCNIHPSPKTDSDLKLILIEGQVEPKTLQPGECTYIRRVRGLGKYGI